jgi:hypothetical protein
MKPAIIVPILIFSVTGICFDDTINHTMDGTWKKGPFTLILDGNRFVFKLFNNYYMLLPFWSVDDSYLTLSV